MELMPHVKALLNDLISMANEITVKRSDIAIANEGQIEETNLYHKYRSIIDGTVNIYSYSLYPRNILMTICNWTSDDSGDYLHYITPHDTKYTKDGYNITVSSVSPDVSNYPTSTNDIWIVRSPITDN